MTHAITVTTQHVNAGDYALCHATTNDDRLVAMWLQSGKRANSPLTQASYLRTWRSFSAFQFPIVDEAGDVTGYTRKPLQAITLEDLQVWRSQLTGKDTTQKTAIATVRSLFSFAVRVGYLRVSPAVMIETPPAPTKAHTRRVLTQGNIERMVDACETDRESALIRCLYSSGARISEVLALRWQDVTPRDNGGAVLYIADGKGHKDREAGISAATYAALLRLRDEDTAEDAYVFATRNGLPVDRQSAHKTIKRVLRRAGLPDNASAHWLRHSHATHVLSRGGNVADLQAQLGHASLATTSTYAHAEAFSADRLAI